MIYTLIRRKGEDIDAIISFDSVTSFDESWSATVTTQTVEKGFNISDNINIEPPTYDIQAILSSYSLFKNDREISWDGESFSTQSNQSNSESHIIARDELIKIFTDRSILTLIESSNNSVNDSLDVKYDEITSGYDKEINNCVITSLSISNPDSATGAFIVSLKLQKIYVALVTTVEVEAGQMTRTLKPLNKTVTNASTDAKTSDSSGTADGSNIAQQIGDNSNVNIPSDSVEVGMTQAQGEARRAAALTPILTENEALKEVLRLSKLTKRGYTMTRQGSGYIVHPI